MVWACLMTVSAVMSVVRHSQIFQWPEWVYFYISITNMVAGAVFTIWYKKRAQRQASGPAQ